MTKRRTLLGVAGSAAIAALATSFIGTAAMAQEVTLKLHQFLPAQANVPKLVLDVWADNVEKDSGGRIKVERYPSMQLGGKPPELIDQAIDGVADIVWTVVGYTPGRFPSTEVFELPFMMTNARATSRAYWQIFDEHLKDTEFKDVHILGTWVHGPGMIHTKDPVTKPEDLQGMKIRGGSRSVNMLLTELGATPVGMPVPAVTEGLSKGVIDGTTIPWEVTTSLKVSELVHNHTEFEGKALYVLTFVLAMNKDKYDSLPEEARAAIDKNSGEAFARLWGEQFDAAIDKFRSAAEQDETRTFTTLSEEQQEMWDAKLQTVIDAWIADTPNGQELYDAFTAAIDEASQ